MSKKDARKKSVNAREAEDAQPAQERGSGGEVRQSATGAQPVLTTKDGMPLHDNQNTLRIAPRGASELSDHVYLDKITHFDRERIPERVVHARGSAAHGYFELTESLAQYTTARILTEVGARTPVFARLSTVVGPAGSADTVRDVRGFAVKFYTEEGNWDLVGNNLPVFFIQDAIKFPDLVHAAKREPDRGFPSASSAHDTFWDFLSLTPEAMHMVMWIMSDRTLPRSLAMMEGFGVHTFRLIDARGEATFVKYHWRPTLGTQSLIFDEATKLAGADPDYHRRELRESIEAGLYPEWELGVQLLSAAEAEALLFDVLDPTKLIPEEIVPLQVIGRMVLDRNPDNFFAEVEQAAFCPSRIVPGMDYSDDPLLQGRVQSYTDTQVYRLGGANFQQLPINRPRGAVHHYQRDGAHQSAVPRGRVAYEPNSLAPDGPRASSTAGQRVAATPPAAGQRGRARSATFADHYSQARLFYASQTAVEQVHLAGALVFELAKVETPAIRERMVGHLRVIDETLAQTVADGLGLDPLPPAAVPAVPPLDLPPTPTLSILARAVPTLRARCIGVLIADGTDAKALDGLLSAIEAEGARAKVIAPSIYGAHVAGGPNRQGELRTADLHLAGAPSVLFDAVALVLAPLAAAALARQAAALDFVRDAFAHLKAIGASEGATALLDAAGIERDEFVVTLGKPAAFLECAKSRLWAREPVLRPLT